MIDLERFKADCQRKRCNRNTMLTSQCVKDYKQENCYNKFIQKQEKDALKRQEKYEAKGKDIEKYLKDKEEQNEDYFKALDDMSDKKWVALKKEITIRDKATCRFFSIMTEDEKKLIRPHLWGDFKKIDGAHCISRSLSPKMVYDVDNVYSLFGYIHKSLDEAFDPFTRQPITKDQVSDYWKRIIGEEKYNELIKRSKE